MLDGQAVKKRWSVRRQISETGSGGGVMLPLVPRAISLLYTEVDQERRCRDLLEAGVT